MTKCVDTDEKIKYNSTSFRLDVRTLQSLKELQEKEGVSWNRLFYRMIKSYKKYGKTNP